MPKTENKFINEIGSYWQHLCKTCWRPTEVEDTGLPEVECVHCGKTAVRKVVVAIDTDPQGLCRCGGKDSLSKWEEIKHRPRGSKGF